MDGEDDPVKERSCHELVVFDKGRVEQNARDDSRPVNELNKEKVCESRGISLQKKNTNYL